MTAHPERWADIPSWPGYLVSSHSRVRSVDRIVVDRRGHRRRWRGRLLKLQPNPNGGDYVSLSHGGEIRTFNVNRLRRMANLAPSSKQAETATAQVAGWPAASSSKGKGCA